MGLKTLTERLNDEEMTDYFTGLFPKDHPKNVKFCINFFTSIGLGALTIGPRKFLKEQQKRAIEERREEIEKLQRLGKALKNDGDDGDGEDDSSDDSGSDSSGGSDTSDSSDSGARGRSRSRSRSDRRGGREQERGGQGG